MRPTEEELERAREALRADYEADLEAIAGKVREETRRQGLGSDGIARLTLELVNDHDRTNDPLLALETLASSPSDGAYFEAQSDELDEPNWSACAMAAMAEDLLKLLEPEYKQARARDGKGAAKEVEFRAHYALSIDMKGIPHADKFAYGSGFLDGVSGRPRARAEDSGGLADGYKRGYAHGVRVGKGEKMPRWATPADVNVSGDVHDRRRSK